MLLLVVTACCGCSTLFQASNQQPARSGRMTPAGRDGNEVTRVQKPVQPLADNEQPDNEQRDNEQPHGEPGTRIDQAALEVVSSDDLNEALKTGSRTGNGTAGDESIGEANPAQPLKLSFDAAVGIALANNSKIRVMSFVPREVATGVEHELAAFDPELHGGGNWATINQQAQSTVQALGTGINRYESSLVTGPDGSQDQLQLQKTWQTGTRTRLGYGTNYSWNPTSGQFLLVNPAWNSGLNVGIEQPLWQGVGRRHNQLGILIAKSQFQKSSAELRAEIHRTLFEINRLYWNYYRQVQNARSLEQTVEQARIILRRETKRLETGSGSAVDVAQAREGLESLLAELSESELQREAALDSLRRGLGFEPGDDRQIELTDWPRRELFGADLLAGIDSAMQARAELQAQSLELRASQLSMERAREMLKPSVSANASYRLTGLGTSLTDSLGQLQGMGNGNWGVGFSFSQPLGRRAAHASHSRAELAVRRARVELEEMRKAIESEVRQSYREISLSHEVLNRQAARLEASREQYRVTERMYETGQVNLDRLIRSQRQLLAAIRDEQDATVRYTLAIGRWYYVTGTMTSVAEGQNSPLDDTSQVLVP